MFARAAVTADSASASDIVPDDFSLCGDLGSSPTGGNSTTGLAAAPVAWDCLNLKPWRPAKKPSPNTSPIITAPIKIFFIKQRGAPLFACDGADFKPTRK